MHFVRSPIPVLLAAAVTVAAGCATTQNFVQPDGPRWAGVPAGFEAGESESDLVVASFNIEGSEAIERALEVIRSEPGLRDADILLLQEMDVPGTVEIAEALGMAWVYYPASMRDGRAFGNAILSRWPIEDDEKLVLPHRSIFGGRARTATVATVRVRSLPIRVYSVHLDTPINQFPGARTAQMTAVLEDAARHPHAVVGGDLNSGSLAERGLDYGFHWATRDGPRTAWFARVDHILYKGLEPPFSRASGTVSDNRGASDHLPVWARALFR